jgi:hypothetical protein
MGRFGIICLFAAVAVAVAAAAKKDESKSKFDPLHLNFGQDKYVSDLRHHFAGKEAQPSMKLYADLEKEAVWGELSAADKTDEAAPAVTERERRLRGKKDVERLDSTLTSPEDGLPFTPEPTTTPATGETPKHKPVKRANDYFEKMKWDGSKNCEFKTGASFRSITVGTHACFPSAISTEDKMYYTSLEFMEAHDSTKGDAMAVTSRIYDDMSCKNELIEKYYLPLLEVEPKECSGTSDSSGDTSIMAGYWELSHSVHRERFPMSQSISLYSHTRDCMEGSEGETLQERVTFSNRKDVCHVNGHSASFQMKCVRDDQQRVSFKVWSNLQCAGDADLNFLMTRDELCNAQWALDYTIGHPLVQCWSKNY